ncbi:N-acetylmuramoyl-L-alanine amidase [Mobiluncus mulieris]|uniref:N-acetylmuramoyl-L-alanine amidase n=2 Tax=Mobiluncus mulieris TaxID=2052 RepID=A0A7Y0Y3W6_9ACTO|nr:N-acetylmuramoyl-L-alanine amidase [Mobiluncus mulieris]
MRDWNRLIADEQYWMAKHYTPGRAQRLRGIVLHHNAANLSLWGCWDVWQTREASAHYQVDVNGRIGQYVRDSDTACASLSANPWSIAIEHANNSFAPTWTISDATLDNGAHLVAALCLAYGLGEPRWGVNVFPHSRFGNTACPGAIAGAQRETYMKRARFWFQKMNNTTIDTNTDTTRKDTEMLLFVDGKWWFQTQGPFARGVRDTDLLQKLSAIMPTIEINSEQLRANWNVIENEDMARDLTKMPGRIRDLKDMHTGYAGMSETLRKTSLLQQIAENLGIEKRTA